MQNAGDNVQGMVGASSWHPLLAGPGSINVEPRRNLESSAPTAAGEGVLMSPTSRAQAGTAAPSAAERVISAATGNPFNMAAFTVHSSIGEASSEASEGVGKSSSSGSQAASSAAYTRGGHGADHHFGPPASATTTAGLDLGGGGARVALLTGFIPFAALAPGQGGGGGGNSSAPQSYNSLDGLPPDHHFAYGDMPSFNGDRGTTPPIVHNHSPGWANGPLMDPPAAASSASGAGPVAAAVPMSHGGLKVHDHGGSALLARDAAAAGVSAPRMDMPLLGQQPPHHQMMPSIPSAGVGGNIAHHQGGSSAAGSGAPLPVMFQHHSTLSTVFPPSEFVFAATSRTPSASAASGGGMIAGLGVPISPTPPGFVPVPAPMQHPATFVAMASSVSPNGLQQAGGSGSTTSNSATTAAVSPPTSTPPARHPSQVMPPWRGARSAPSGKSLFITKLHPSVDFIMLRNAFAKYGKVISTRVLFDAVTGASRGIGYVNFEHAIDAHTAMTELNGTVIGQGHAPSYVKLADEDSSFVAEETNKVFVRRVPLTATVSVVNEVFSTFGTITQVTLHRDAALAEGVVHPTITEPINLATAAAGDCLMAYVTFNTVDDAVTAVAQSNGKFLFPGASEPLIVKLAETMQCRKHRLSRLKQHEALVRSGVLPPTSAGGAPAPAPPSGSGLTPTNVATVSSDSPIVPVVGSPGGYSSAPPPRLPPPSVMSAGGGGALHHGGGGIFYFNPTSSGAPSFVSPPSSTSSIHAMNMNLAPTVSAPTAVATSGTAQMAGSHHHVQIVNGTGAPATLLSFPHLQGGPATTAATFTDANGITYQWQPTSTSAMMMQPQPQHPPTTVPSQQPQHPHQSPHSQMPYVIHPSQFMVMPTQAQQAQGPPLQPIAGQGMSLGGGGGAFYSMAVSSSQHHSGLHPGGRGASAGSSFSEYPSPMHPSGPIGNSAAAPHTQVRGALSRESSATSVTSGQVPRDGHSPGFATPARASSSTTFGFGWPPAAQAGQSASNLQLQPSTSSVGSALSHHTSVAAFHPSAQTMMSGMNSSSTPELGPPVMYMPPPPPSSQSQGFQGGGGPPMPPPTTSHGGGAPLPQYITLPPGMTLAPGISSFPAGALPKGSTALYAASAQQTPTPSPIGGHHHQQQHPHHHGHSGGIGGHSPPQPQPAQIVQFLPPPHNSQSYSFASSGGQPASATPYVVWSTAPQPGPQAPTLAPSGTTVYLSTAPGGGPSGGPPHQLAAPFTTLQHFQANNSSSALMPPQLLHRPILQPQPTSSMFVSGSGHAFVDPPPSGVNPQQAGGVQPSAVVTSQTGRGQQLHSQHHHRPSGATTTAAAAAAVTSVGATMQQQYDSSCGW